MRTAPRRVRSLLALFALVCSVGWMLLRRRSEPAAEPAVEPAVEPVAGRPVDVLATDAGLTPQPAVEPAPAADPEPVTEVPTEVLATDA
ncbi:MAG TPA: hypothetical protein VE547_03215, partial [Mycobacteriales bacterium]|nr:hypothetical protein [Mycobacteriales bacterium]